MMNRRRGFTLIELLVVIAIIGLLSSVVLASLNSARSKARDVRRKEDLQTIAKVLQAYFADKGTVPNPNTVACFSVNHVGGESWGLDNGSSWYGGGNSPLIPAYISAIPSDPLYASSARAGNYMYFSPGYLSDGFSQICAALEGTGNGVSMATTCGTTVTYNYCLNFK